MKRPKGAITSIDELMACKNKTLYPASRKHFKRLGVTPFEFDGMVSEELIDGFIPYAGGYKARFIKAPGRISGILSLLDMNVIPNTYNDWFLFSNYADALAYIYGDK